MKPETPKETKEKRKIGTCNNHTRIILTKSNNTANPSASYTPPYLNSYFENKNPKSHLLLSQDLSVCICVYLCVRVLFWTSLLNIHSLLSPVV